MKRAFHQTEHLRLHCLQQMGISSYYPRFLLPGALPSVALLQEESLLSADLPHTIDTAGAQPQPGIDSPALANGAQDRTEAVFNGDVPPVSARVPAHPEPRSSAGHSALERKSQPRRESGTGADSMPQTLQFQLLLLPVSAELAILLQLPALARPMLQPRQALLLQNMLRWLGLPVELPPQPRRFQWPLPGMKTGTNTAEAALGLRHFVEQAVLEQPFRRLLLLGQQLAEQLTGASLVPATLPLTCTHSLDAMLAVPALKREAWQALLPLHAALQSP